MSGTPASVEKCIRLPVKSANRLSHLAQAHRVDEDHVIEKALDILFSLTDLFDASVEQQGWSTLSEASLQRVWNNDQDAVYDNWRESYGVPPR